MTVAVAPWRTTTPVQTIGHPSGRQRAARCFVVLAFLSWGSSGAAEHPRLLFSSEEVVSIRGRAGKPPLKDVAKRLMERAEWMLSARPLLVSLSGRGEPDKAGEIKGLAAARNLQGRVLTYCMAFTLTGEKRYRDAAVKELDHALSDWPIWVDTAHPPPYDLMTGENCLTFGLAFDWLYQDLTPGERERLRQGAERRGLKPYLDATRHVPAPSWLTAKHNWNTVCNGGATILALALETESDLSKAVLDQAVPAMKNYWSHLGADGGWDEGTGYWTYGHRYGFTAAEALRRCGRGEGATVFESPGAKRTGYFPLIFNPGRRISASFGDSNSRANDPILYLLGREYKNPDFVWFQDRAGLRGVENDGWPAEAMTLLWRPVGEAWLPENHPGFAPTLEAVSVFPSIGWAMLTPSQPDPPFFLAFKNGSLAANHTHLDLNHISIGWGDTMLAVELGSRPYPADYFSRKRYSYYEITTRGHNTLLLGGQGQVPGRTGRLVGPIKGQGYEEIVGVADGAYEVPAERVRRHIVFVDKRYFVVLDEIELARPAPVELRFHTYGKVLSEGPERWKLSQDQAELDVVPAFREELEARTEAPEGWIKPVSVLSFMTPRSDNHMIVTLLHPHAAGTRSLGPVGGHHEKGGLTITVGADQLHFEHSSDGWRVSRVQLARP